MSVSVANENESEKHLNETIFDLNGPTDEKLDEEKVRYSLYNEINLEKSRAGEDEKWNLRMTCIMEWFIRCSWINKFLFIDQLCNTTTGVIVLEDVLKTIQSIFSKDVLESLSTESTNYCYDRIPTDDNRALESSELNTAMQNALSWFTGLNPRAQIRVILKLLRLGGGGLVLKIYKSAERIYYERQDPEAVMSFMSTTVLSKMKEKGKKSKSKLSVKISVTKQSLQDSDPSSYMENIKLSEFAAKKQEQLKRRDKEFLNYKKWRGILEDESKKEKKKELRETVDYLQILPIWLNRRIMSYIDDKSLAGFKKVGKYWGKMIDESINEKSGRKAINAKINKIIGIKADKEEKKKEGEGDEEEDEFLVEMGLKDLINKKNESEAALMAKAEFYKEVFSRKCNIKNLDSSYNPERCGAYDSAVGTIASSTSNKMIHFYSSRTGARFNFLLFGLEATVTCLSLHEDRTHVFIGCIDGSLICKNMRTNVTTCTFQGHMDAVLSIFTTSCNLLSSSLDNNVKYFQLWSGVCLLCVDLNPVLHISSVLQRSDKPSCVAIGTKEGALVLVDVEAKKFLVKIKLHKDEITQLAQDEEFLVTGSKSGKIRVWNMNYLKSQSVILRPYFNVDVESPVTSLRVFKNQIFSGCENGTVKIIPLIAGNIFKTLKISSLSPITGVDISEDKLFVKLIIWHEKGIEIRTFSLQKSSSKKISKEKDNQECKQKAPKETKKNKMSEMDLCDYAKTAQGIILGKSTTFPGNRKPLQERCCTLSYLRAKPKTGFTKSSLFTEVYNLTHTDPQDLRLFVFPRLKNPNTQKQ